MDLHRFNPTLHTPHRKIMKSRRIILNQTLSYAMENGLSLTVWGRNLLNDRTLLQIFDSPAQTGSLSGYPNQPRTYGVSARFTF